MELVRFVPSADTATVRSLRSLDFANADRVHHRRSHLTGLDARVTTWGARRGDNFLFMAGVRVWGLRVNVLIPNLRGRDYALMIR
jgi:hypothetical protein